MFEPSEFFNFLKRPQYLSIERKKTHILSTVLKIYLLALLFVGLVNLINITILKVFFTLPIDETFDVPGKLKEHLWIFFILVAFIGPFLEEVVFRLSLIFSPVNISLTLAIIIALIVHKVSNWFLAITTFLILFYLINRLTSSYRLNLLSFWNRNFKYIFYFLSIIFGLVHISNYKFIEASQYLIAPIIVFPQLAIGFILSFTRVYYEKGFLIAIFVHVLMNTISVSLTLLQYSK